MTTPELVIVPARPRNEESLPVEFEIRTQADGRAMLPVFSSVAALVRELGRFQPWVCVPWRLAEEAASRATLSCVVLDPVADPSAERWTAADLTHLCGEAGANE
jgi:hypothetical protein